MGLVCKNSGRICNGCGECQEEGYYACPICGEETDYLYVNNDDEIVGCDNCVVSKNAWEALR
jgi:hypothetical protein